jgi:hypothetical protein
MKKCWLALIGLVLLLAMVSLNGCTAGYRTPVTAGVTSLQKGGISVSGVGKVTVTPDIATVSLGISAQAASVAEAQSQATGAMNKVMAALTANGVANKDIQTQRFSITQVTKWDSNKQQDTVIGYRVTNMVTAKIREVDKTGAIIDAVAAAGGDPTRISSVSFSVDDPSPYYKEARQKAVADARAEGEQLAEFSGVKLGKLINISESATYPIYLRSIEVGAAALAPAPTTPISPGETELTITVQATYATSDW